MKDNGCGNMMGSGGRISFWKREISEEDPEKTTVNSLPVTRFEFTILTN